MNARLLVLGAGLVAAVSFPVSAHHSFAAEFDITKPIALKGAVTKLEWMNPHIWLYLDVQGTPGGAQHWQCEGGAPNTLTRNGWNKDSLKIGDEVTVEGYLAKDGSKTCNMRVVKLPNGQSVFAGSSAGTGQPRH